MQNSKDQLEPQSDTQQESSADTSPAPTQSAPFVPEPGAPEVGTPRTIAEADEVPNQASPVTNDGEQSSEVPEDQKLQAEVADDAAPESDVPSNQASPVTTEETAPNPAPDAALVSEADETVTHSTAPQAAEGKKGLAEWWSGLGAEVKDFADLREDGNLILKATAGQPERTIATLSQDGKEATLKALLDKHVEVKERVEKLRAEWDAAADKGRLGGRVGGLREYLLRAPSLGNYAELYALLEPMEGELSRHAEASHAARLALVEEAEALAESSDWKAATTALRDMTDRWKASPPLDKNRADELWGRLEKARDKFFERKRLANEELDKELMNNLDKKLELVDKAEAYAASDDWRKTTEALKGLMDEWKSVGRAAGGRDEELWARFSAAKTVFFDRKKGHFDTIQKEQEENLARKIALVEKAEALQDSTDWNKTSAAFEEVLQEWRRVGKVPMEKADEIRDRMERAKDTFFSARRSHFETVKVSLTDNYAQKLALLKRAEDLKHSTQWREATGEFTELMEEWKQIGPVPREHSRRIWQEFMAARSFFFDRKDADRDKRNERFQQQSVARVDSQRQFLKKLEDELAEEKDNLADFRVSIGNITPGPKAKELHEHLTKLIAQSEERIGRKEAKLEQVRKEVQAIIEPKPSSGRERRPERDRNRDERRGGGRNREDQPQEELAHEFSAEVPAGLPVEQAAAAAAIFTPSSADENDASNEEPPAAAGGESGTSSERDGSASQESAPTSNESPDTVKETTDTPAASTGADESSFAPNIDVVPPSVGEQAVAGASSTSPDAVPPSETSTPPMQTGEDSGAVDEASATVD